MSNSSREKRWQSLRLIQLGWLALSVGLGYGVAYTLVKLTSGPSAENVRQLADNRKQEREQHEWVEPIVQSQSFYVANTLQHIESDLEAVLAELAKVTQSTQLRTALPDLATEGYTVKRVQELGFLGQPLVQLLYSKADHRPLAICILPARGGPDSRLQLDRYHGLGTASWVENDQRFVLVADESHATLQQLYRITRGVFSST